MIPIKSGERGARVYEVQRGLKALAQEIPAPALDPGTEDAIFGQKTASAVLAFQAAFVGLPQSGMYVPGEVNAATATVLINVAYQRAKLLMRIDRINSAPNTPLGDDDNPEYSLPEVVVTPGSSKSWLWLALAGAAVYLTTRP